VTSFGRSCKRLDNSAALYYLKLVSEAQASRDSRTQPLAETAPLLHPTRRHSRSGWPSPRDESPASLSRTANCLYEWAS